MRKILFFILAIFIFVYLADTNFFTRNVAAIGDATTKWLVDHTPKK